jgi:hypothetical protein
MGGAPTNAKRKLSLLQMRTVPCGTLFYSHLISFYAVNAAASFAQKAGISFVNVRTGKFTSYVKLTRGVLLVCCLVCWHSVAFYSFP